MIGQQQAYQGQIAELRKESQRQAAVLTVVLERYRGENGQLSEFGEPSHEDVIERVETAERTTSAAKSLPATETVEVPVVEAAMVEQRTVEAEVIEGPVVQATGSVPLTLEEQPVKTTTETIEESLADQ